MRNLLFTIILFSFLSAGCQSYRANIMFRDYTTAQLQMEKDRVERSYTIQANDYLTLDVFTNKGERIIDPDYALMDANQRISQNREEKQYLVRDDGYVKLPVAGDVKLAGLTLYEAEEALEGLYSEYYNDVFVKLGYNNKRAIILGAAGGHVAPLVNENMNLLETLAMVGGLGDNAKVYNIRLIRGNLNNPEVHVIDLSTIEGMKKANLKIYPNDIIYVEPVKKVVNETLRDISPALSLITSIATLVLLIGNL